MKSKVFFTKTITPESLINIYQALGVDVTKGGTAKVGVKVSTGEDGAKLLQERIDSRLGREILPYAEELGLGSREYELVEI